MNRAPNPNAPRPSFSWPVIALLAVEAFAATVVFVGTGVGRNVDGGVYTGEIASGGPVYRLPTITVVADRKTELARIERDEQRERERQAREKAGRPAA